MGRKRETTVASVIFRANNNREEVQSLKGKGERNYRKSERENYDV